MTTPLKDMTPAERHSAGATVLHRSPFEDLPVPTSPVEMSADVRQRFVIPFYRYLPYRLGEIAQFLRGVLQEVTLDILGTLLAEPDWRPRITGALFAAIHDDVGRQDDIGRLLLRSDVCYAGRGYCVALARFNTPEAAGYLREYLEYYLRRFDLRFDQADAMAALHHLHSRNGTAHAAALQPLWERFTLDKPTWRLDSHRPSLERAMRHVAGLASLLREAPAPPGESPRR